jgi:hypothetical protein
MPAKLKLNLKQAAVSVAASKRNSYYQPNRPTRKRMSTLKRQFRGFSKISVVLDAAFNKMTSGSPSVHESLRRLFERVMLLKAPHEMHARLEASGKKNWVPQRYLLIPPKAKGQVHGKAHTALGDQESARFDDAAQRIASAFGNDSAAQSRMQNLLQIFSHYSALQANGFRTFGLEDFLKLLEDVKLTKFTEYRASEQALCWRAFSRSKTGAKDPKTMTRRIDFQAFVDGFPLVSPFVFRTSSRPPHELSEVLLEEHILPRAQRVRSDPLTLALLWNEDAQRMLQDFGWPLQIIFRHFASLYEDAVDVTTAAAGPTTKATASNPHTDGNGDSADGSDKRGEGATKTWNDPISKAIVAKRKTMKQWSTPLSGDDTMDWQEFLKLLRSFQVVGSRADQLTEKAARGVFDEANLSEISDTDVDRLSWHEYLEALGRCALLLFPLDDPDMNKKFAVEKEQVHFQPLSGMRLTHGLKAAVKTVFNSSDAVGKNCFAPKGQPIVRQLSPRAQRSVDRGWCLRQQAPVGSRPWIALGKPSAGAPWASTLVHRGGGGASTAARKTIPMLNKAVGVSRKARFEARAKVKDHMSESTMRRTQAHKHDYVHERGVHPGEGPDVVHAKPKVRDHALASTMRLTRPRVYDYVFEQGLHEGEEPDVAHAKPKVDDHMAADLVPRTKVNRHNYVRERGLHDGNRPDIAHAGPRYGLAAQ